MLLHINKFRHYHFWGGNLCGLSNIKSIELTKNDIEGLIKEIQHNPKRINFYLENLKSKMKSEIRGQSANLIIIDDPLGE